MANGVTHYHLDYILAPRHFKSSINRAKSKTFPGVDNSSNDDTVMIAMKLKLKQKLAESRPKALVQP